MAKAEKPSKFRMNPVNLIYINTAPSAAPKASKMKKKEKFLMDLGRATRRGVKNCPNCGCINGTRVIRCKNTFCNMIFRESHKQKILLDSCKLITGTSIEIYSILVRDNGPEKRGFVQLPSKNNEAGTDLKMGLCFVNSCQSSFNDSILKCHENNDNSSTICSHINSAMKTASVASALPFKHDLINNLLVSEDVKKKLCSLAKSTNGPVVQKINKVVYAVKCAVTVTNTLGYLHALFVTKANDGQDELELFHCSCYGNTELTSEKCIHYYACIVAFTSDTRYNNKFKSILKKEFDSSMNFNTDESKNLEIMVVQTNLLPSDMKNIIRKTNPASLNLKKDGKIPLPKVASVNCAPNPHSTDVSFNEWLSSVTERINLSIYDDEEETLSFHIPNRFYDFLTQQFALIDENFAPEEITTILRETAPVGTFKCIIWKIYEMKDLRTVFNSKKIKLLEPRLLIDLENPMTFYWMGNLLLKTSFGELKITYRTKKTINKKFKQ